MAGQRQPIELVLAKGSKHLTKKEIEERKSSEVKPITDDISPPPYLSTKKQKGKYERFFIGNLYDHSTCSAGVYRMALKTAEARQRCKQ